jgi:hypothetical protein
MVSRAQRRAHPRNREIRKNEFHCMICITDIPVSNKYNVLNCAHTFCAPCITNYKNVNKFKKLICPAPNCRSILQQGCELKYGSDYIEPEMDEETKKYFDKFVDICERCKIPTVRYNGCPKVTCINCNFEFTFKKEISKEIFKEKRALWRRLITSLDTAGGFLYLFMISYWSFLAYMTSHTLTSAIIVASNKLIGR